MQCLEGLHVIPKSIRTKWTKEILENTNFIVASLLEHRASVFAGLNPKEYEFVIFIKQQLLQPCLSG